MSFLANELITLSSFSNFEIETSKMVRGHIILVAQIEGTTALACQGAWSCQNSQGRAW